MKRMGIGKDSRSVLLGVNYQQKYEDMDVGATMELSLGKKTALVTISGLFDVAKMANGHGARALDSAALFTTERLSYGLCREIENFDYSWSAL